MVLGHHLELRPGCPGEHVKEPGLHMRFERYLLHVDLWRRYLVDFAKCRIQYCKCQLEMEARSRVTEKKPPMAIISLGTDVDAPRGEKMETSGKYEYQIMRLGCPTASCGWDVKIQT